VTGGAAQGVPTSAARRLLDDAVASQQAKKLASVRGTRLAFFGRVCQGDIG